MANMAIVSDLKPFFTTKKEELDGLLSQGGTNIQNVVQAAADHLSQNGNYPINNGTLGYFGNNTSSFVKNRTIVNYSATSSATKQNVKNKANEIKKTLESLSSFRGFEINELGTLKSFIGSWTGRIGGVPGAKQIITQGANEQIQLSDNDRRGIATLTLICDLIDNATTSSYLEMLPSKTTVISAVAGAAIGAGSLYLHNNGMPAALSSVTAFIPSLNQ